MRSPARSCGRAAIVPDPRQDTTGVCAATWGGELSPIGSYSIEGWRRVIEVSGVLASAPDVVGRFDLRPVKIINPDDIRQVTHPVKQPPIGGDERHFKPLGQLLSIAKDLSSEIALATLTHFRRRWKVLAAEGGESATAHLRASLCGLMYHRPGAP